MQSVDGDGGGYDELLGGGCLLGARVSLRISRLGSSFHTGLIQTWPHSYLNLNCVQVRGKDFRHEKTKKKRGSYRGGVIDTNARCSYKFDSDDE